MADDEDESGDEDGADAADEPAVELGDAAPVEGAPIARVAARLHYGIPASEVERREGDTVVRTPDGPRPLEELLAAIDETYFARREDLEASLRAVAGRGPIPTGDAGE